MAKKGLKRVDRSKTAQKLRRLRQALGYNQREMAVEFKVSPGTIALWELEERSIPGPAQVLIEIFQERLTRK